MYFLSPSLRSVPKIEIRIAVTSTIQQFAIARGSCWSQNILLATMGINYTLPEVEVNLGHREMSITLPVKYSILRCQPIVEATKFLINKSF
jgi:hypothetical protein